MHARWDLLQNRRACRAARLKLNVRALWILSSLMALFLTLILAAGPEARAEPWYSATGAAPAFEGSGTRAEMSTGRIARMAEPEHVAVPVIDLTEWLENGNVGNEAEISELCRAVARSLMETGVLLVRDPRVSEEENEEFLDTMEQYFAKAKERRSQQGQLKEERPDLHYQDAELQAELHRQAPGQRGAVPIGADPKWRYMWRVGERPRRTAFRELNSEPVAPPGMQHWARVMDAWGQRMLATAAAVAELAAEGLGLARDAFASRMTNGPHLLAPTGTDLAAHGQLGRCFAGFHYDMNFLTLHGRSRFPGLHIWQRDGARVPVSVPPGCILVQAGKQMEWLTGGAVRAGFHEVVCTHRTLAAISAASARGRALWRVSSTIFTHIASDCLLQPLGSFATAPALQQYPPCLAGEQVKQELSCIKLRRGSDACSPPLVVKPDRAGPPPLTAATGLPNP